MGTRFERKREGGLKGRESIEPRTGWMGQTKGRGEVEERTRHGRSKSSGEGTSVGFEREQPQERKRKDVVDGTRRRERRPSENIHGERGSTRVFMDLCRSLECRCGGTKRLTRVMVRMWKNEAIRRLLLLDVRHEQTGVGGTVSGFFDDVV